LPRAGEAPRPPQSRAAVGLQPAELGSRSVVPPSGIAPDSAG